MWRRIASRAGWTDDGAVHRPVFSDLNALRMRKTQGTGQALAGLPAAKTIHDADFIKPAAINPVFLVKELGVVNQELLDVIVPECEDLTSRPFPVSEISTNPDCPTFSSVQSRDCIHGHHAPLSQDMVGFVGSEFLAVRHQLDVLCRFVLILCGVEQRSSDGAALLLGISKRAVTAAYCAALDSLEVIWCHAILVSGSCIDIAN